jgi:topoisomerase-4 subunit B
MREFCEIRNLLPRGVKITPEDVWELCHYILSVKLEDPQFSGQTKERLSSRECVAFVSGVGHITHKRFGRVKLDIADSI